MSHGNCAANIKEYFFAAHPDVQGEIREFIGNPHKWVS
ncbi:MAG: hypothetical protein RLZZ480_647 [Candidatus Parcubacteria bacterium]|jgi:hypothetical protein